MPNTSSMGGRGGQVLRARRREMTPADSITSAVARRIIARVAGHEAP